MQTPSSRQLLMAYALSTLFFVLSSLNFGVGLRLRGFYTDKIVAWLWLGFTIYTIIKFWKNVGAKIYLGCLGLLLLGSILAMMIPFFAILFHFSTMGVKAHYNLGDGYRLEQKQSDPLSFEKLYIYQPKYLIFEETLARPMYKNIVERLYPNHTDNQLDELSELPIEDAQLIKIDSETIVLNLKINGAVKRVEIPLYDEVY